MSVEMFTVMSHLVAISRSFWCHVLSLGASAHTAYILAADSLSMQLKSLSGDIFL